MSSNNQLRAVPDYVSLKALANELAMDRSQARKFILKLGFKPRKRRTPDSGGQPALTLTLEEATEVIRRRREEWADSATAATVPSDSDHGYFYVIQLVPELDEGRIKMGFTASISTRLTEHRCSAPTALVAKTWPCRRVWERTAIDALSSQACEHILNEVFQCSDLGGLLERGDSFFALLPHPEGIPILSAHSPLRQPDNAAPPSACPF